MRIVHQGNTTKTQAVEKRAGHCLEELFDKISTDMKKNIILQVGINNFEEELSMVSNAFQEWRYIYEMDIHSINLRFLTNFAVALRESAKANLNEVQ